jgi:hypothetical protein
MSAKRQRQGKAFNTGLQAGDQQVLRKLYKDMHFIPKQEHGTLLKLGLLRRITLDPSDFLPISRGARSFPV